MLYYTKIKVRQIIMTKGRIHSIESFGTVDGPGLRFVVFTQGCPMRCAYCHNPDTWAMNAGELMDPADIIEQYERNRSFYRNGGITVTGGEPLVQVDFLIDLFTLAKARDIHTCIDTSGITYSEKNRELFDKILSNTNLVMLDIKHIDGECHKQLTGHSNENILKFAKYVDTFGVDIWIRHVVVEGYTDSHEHLFALGKFIGTLKNLRALDVLPYHTMGKHKYSALGLDYPLADMPALSQSAALNAKKIILDGISEARKK